MSPQLLTSWASLRSRLENRVLSSTHGRVRNLAIEDVNGRYVVKGQVPSQHTKQLALEGALELLPEDRFSVDLTVGPFEVVTRP